MQDFRKLRVWRAAQDLAVAVHGMTQSLHGTDAAGLRSQVRRSALSIAANVAEGAVSGSPRQFARFLQMAIASTSETESHLDFGIRVSLLPEAEAGKLMQDTVVLRRQLISLRKRVLEAANQKPGT